MDPRAYGPTKMSLKTPEYLPASCNIGHAEVKRRQAFGILAAIVSLGYWLISILMHAPHGIRALVFFPLVMATIGWFQSRRKFCLAYGILGVFNFGKLGEATPIMDPVLKSADRAYAFRILAKSACIAAVFALLLTLIPA